VSYCQDKQKAIKLPSILNFVDIQGFIIVPHDVSKRTQKFYDFLFVLQGDDERLLKKKSKLTLTTSTGSFFMLFGQVSSGLFSDSPGRSNIFNLFLTSSMRSFAALESSKRSLRTINLRGTGSNF
jgi:hypothetical protein